MKIHFVQKFVLCTMLYISRSDYTYFQFFRVIQTIHTGHRKRHREEKILGSGTEIIFRDSTITFKGRRKEAGINVGRRSYEQEQEQEQERKSSSRRGRRDWIRNRKVSVS